MDKKQREFIILRADGISFDKISTQLKVSKATLIQWSKLLEDEIKDLQFESFIKIKESYSWNTQKRYELLLKQLEKIEDNILKADLSKSNIKDLYSIQNDILYKLDLLEKKVSTNPKVTITNDLGYKQNLDLKLNEIN